MAEYFREDSTTVAGLNDLATAFEQVTGSQATYLTWISLSNFTYGSSSTTPHAIGANLSTSDTWRTFVTFSDYTNAHYTSSFSGVAAGALPTFTSLLKTITPSEGSLKFALTSTGFSLTNSSNTTTNYTCRNNVKPRFLAVAVQGGGGGGINGGGASYKGVSCGASYTNAGGGGGGGFFFGILNTTTISSYFNSAIDYIDTYFTAGAGGSGCSHTWINSASNTKGGYWATTYAAAGAASSIMYNWSGGTEPTIVVSANGGGAGTGGAGGAGGTVSYLSSYWARASSVTGQAGGYNGANGGSFSAEATYYVTAATSLASKMSPVGLKLSTNYIARSGGTGKTVLISKTGGGGASRSGSGGSGGSSSTSGSSGSSGGGGGAGMYYAQTNTSSTRGGSGGNGYIYIWY